jgi:hypothetical protein
MSAYGSADIAFPKTAILIQFSSRNKTSTTPIATVDQKTFASKDILYIAKSYHHSVLSALDSS